MEIIINKSDFKKLKKVKEWYKEHPEEYGKMIRESTDEELYRDIIENGCSTDIKGELFGLEKFIKEKK